MAPSTLLCSLAGEKLIVIGGPDTLSNATSSAPSTITQPQVILPSPSLWQSSYGWDGEYRSSNIHTLTHSLSLVLVVMIKAKELKTKISHTHSLAVPQKMMLMRICLVSRCVCVTQRKMNIDKIPAKYVQKLIATCKHDPSYADRFDSKYGPGWCNLSCDRLVQPEL